MNPQSAFLVVMFLVTLGSYGWGSAIVWVLSGQQSISSRRVRLDAPMNIAIGVASCFAFGGWLVAANLAYPAPLFVWLGTGSLFTAAVVFRRIKRARGLNVSFKQLATAVIAVGGLLVALAPLGLARWSEADDAPGYTYLSQRLIATGGLIDPFNSRRLQNYGGAELLQSLVAKAASTSAIDSIEAVFFCSLALALLIRSLRRPYAALMIGTVGLAILLIQPVGDWSNTGPTFSETVLVLALARLLADNQRPDERQLWLFILGGLIFAGIFSLRPQGVPAGLAVMVAGILYVKTRSAKLQSLLICGGSAAAALAGWAIALKRSSDAWVFGIAMPSWTQASWSIDPEIRSISRHVAFIRSLMAVDSWSTGVIGAVLVLVIGGAAAYATALRSGVPEGLTALATKTRLDLLVALILGNVALLGIFAYQGNGDALDSIGHYFAPILLSLVLFAIDRAWLVATNENALGFRRIELPVVLACCIVFTYLFGNTTLSTLGSELKSSANKSIRILRGTRLDFGTKQSLDLPYQQFHYQQLYAQLEQKIPRGSYILSAVEFPGELDFNRFRFATVDEAYGNSPPPHLPPDGNPVTTVRYLRSLGITGILGEALHAPFYYNYDNNYIYSHQPVRNYQLQDGSLVKWDLTLVKIETLYKTTAVDDIVYVDLTAPTH